MSDFVDGHAHRVWRNNEGRAVIETYSIAGMGHGTPLGTTGENCYGASGPFMLEVGISSTLRIAQFWGILPREASAGMREAAVSASASSATPLPTLRPADSRSNSEPRCLKDIKIERRPDAANGSKVQRVIEDALRSAGLIK